MLKRKVNPDDRLTDFLLKCDNSDFLEVSRRIHVFDNAIDFLKLVGRKENLFFDFHLKGKIRLELTYHPEEDTITAALIPISQE